jgi:Flp pilus assembly protein TadD/arylsulfatase A-like enzyme
MRRLLLFLCLALLACRGEPSKPARRPVLFVGLDGADWELLDVYVKDGKMPNLAALAREGRTGVLETIQPPLSPLVWTTMMTGVSPLEHGILDFTRLNPETGAEEPITRSERRVPAVWNLAALKGKSVAVFGMWATWPAEPVPGLLVADRFFSFTARDRRPPPGIVHPPDREAWARGILEKVEQETGYEALRAYLPWLERAEYDRLADRPDPYAHPVSALRRILIETRAYDALAHSWLETETPDLTLLYFQGTDTIGHELAPFAPPRRPEVSEEDFERYRRVPELYFAEVDRLLGGYRKLAEARGAVLMIASDHGFLWGDRRPVRLSSAGAATAGLWHRDQGIYLLWGPGIEPGGRAGGRVDQVCATLLALLRLPPGKGLAGPPLPGVPASTGEPEDYRARWRPAPVPKLETGSGGEEEVAKLRALGYLGSDRGGRAHRGETRTAASYNNEGLLLKEAGRTAEAAQAFQHALTVSPDNASALWNLSELLHARGDLERSDDLLLRALEAGLPDGVERMLGRVRSTEAGRRFRLLERATAVLPGEPKLHLARAQALFESRQCKPALAEFEEAARLAPGEALAHNGVGIARLCLSDPAGAARAFRRSLEIKPGQPEIRRALAELGG